MSSDGQFIERMKRKHAAKEGLLWTEYVYLRNLARAYSPTDSWNVEVLLKQAEKTLIERLTARLTR